MPVYNAGKYLHPAIDSILRQTYRDFELLIIDDGSTDDSREISRAFDDPRIRRVENGANLGLIRTLNKGLELARGEYIARMDGDDISLPERLDRQIAFMEQHPAIGICGTWYEKLENDRVSTVELPTAHGAIRFFMLFDNPFQHSTMLIRRAFLQAHALHFSLAHVHAEDYELWSRCAELTATANLPQALVRYRAHPDNVSHRHQAAQGGTADQVRGRQLHNLGIGASEAELRLHNRLAKFQPPAGDDRPEDIRRWLEKLLDLGCARCGIPASLAHPHLVRYWYGALGNFAHEGLRTWRLFRQSPIGRAAAPNWQAKLLLRCLLRKDIPRLAVAPPT